MLSITKVADGLRRLEVAGFGAGVELRLELSALQLLPCGEQLALELGVVRQHFVELVVEGVASDGAQGELRFSSDA